MRTGMTAFISLWAAIMAAPVQAQPAPTDRPWAFLSASADEPIDRAPTAPIRNILLRPNVEMAFHVYVHNPTDKAQDVDVIVASGQSPADELARASVRVPVRSTVRVAAPKAPPGTPPDKPAPGGPIRSALFLRVLDKAGDVIDRGAAMSVRIQVPSDYVQASASFVGEPGATKNRLTVTVRDQTPLKPFSGPPAKIRLVLSTDRIKALIPESAHDGTFQAEVPPGGEAVLVANNLRFRDAERRGVVAVSVDDYHRAFLYTTDFGGTAPQPVNTPDLRLVVPRFSQPGKPFPVRLEVDNPPRADAIVEFGIDRTGTDAFVTKRYPSGEREEAVAVRWGGPEGGLTFTTKVADRVENLDTAGVFGPRRLRLRLLLEKDKKFEELRPPVPVYEEVVFDETAPVIASFGVKEKDIIRNKSVTLQANGTDAESGVSTVVFFLGDPPTPDGKAAPGGRIIAATPPKEAGAPYTATVTLPDAKRLNVGVKFTNPLGLVAVKTIELEPGDPPEPKKTGTIKGIVVQGPAERLQKKQPVKLSDSKGMEVKTVDTNDKGAFTFEDVQPGKYIVTTEIPRDRTRAKKDVTIEAGKTVELKMVLLR